MLFRYRQRVALSLIAAGFLFGGLVLRLLLFQLQAGHIYTYAAFRQQTEMVSLEAYPRGSILDRNGISLTGEHWVQKVAVFPALLREKEQVAVGLAAILGVPVDAVAARIGQHPVCLPYSLTYAQAEAVKKANWPGVVVVPFKERYGAKPLAVHVTGYLGKIASLKEYSRLVRAGKAYTFGDWVGRTGCEYYYEYLLKGEVPSAAAGIYRDARGKVLCGLGVRVTRFADPHRADLVLAIDSRVQQVVEAVMDARVRRGAVVVLAAGKGDILAVASRPTFSPADPAGARQHGAAVFVDRAFALYPPGSVFKILVAAAALEEGVVRLEDRFLCRGGKDPLIPCWHHAGHGVVTFAQAFAYSCNPVFARVGLTLGKARLLTYYRRCGFTERGVVGYPLPKDARQEPGRYLQPHNLVNLSVGQGPLLVTPIQMAALVNAVVSQGVYVRPRLVKGFRWPDGFEELPPDLGRRVFSAQTAARLREMMVLSVTLGTGRLGDIGKQGCGGKTGTAEAGSGGKIAWFAGFAPAAQPKYVVVVVVEDAESGAASAGPVFREIVQRLLTQENLQNTPSSLLGEGLKY